MGVEAFPLFAVVLLSNTLYVTFVINDGLMAMDCHVDKFVISIFNPKLYIHYVLFDIFTRT